MAQLFTNTQERKTVLSRLAKYPETVEYGAAMEHAREAEYLTNEEETHLRYDCGLIMMAEIRRYMIEVNKEWNICLDDIARSQIFLAGFACARDPHYADVAWGEKGAIAIADEALRENRLHERIVDEFVRSHVAITLRGVAENHHVNMSDEEFFRLLGFEAD